MNRPAAAPAGSGGRRSRRPGGGRRAGEPRRGAGRRPRAGSRRAAVPPDPPAERRACGSTPAQTGGVDLLQTGTAINPHRPIAVDEDVGDPGVGEVRLQRTSPKQVSREAGPDLVDTITAQPDGFEGHQLVQPGSSGGWPRRILARMPELMLMRPHPGARRQATMPPHGRAPAGRAPRPGAPTLSWRPAVVCIDGESPLVAPATGQREIEMRREGLGEVGPAGALADHERRLRAVPHRSDRDRRGIREASRRDTGEQERRVAELQERLAGDVAGRVDHDEATSARAGGQHLDDLAVRRSAARRRRKDARPADLGQLGEDGPAVNLAQGPARSVHRSPGRCSAPGRHVESAAAKTAVDGHDGFQPSLTAVSASATVSVDAPSPPALPQTPRTNARCSDAMRPPWPFIPRRDRTCMRPVHRGTTGSRVWTRHLPAGSGVTHSVGRKGDGPGRGRGHLPAGPAPHGTGRISARCGPTPGEKGTAPVGGTTGAVDAPNSGGGAGAPARSTPRGSEHCNVGPFTVQPQLSAVLFCRFHTMGAA